MSDVSPWVLPPMNTSLFTKQSISDGVVERGLRAAISPCRSSGSAPTSSVGTCGGRYDAGYGPRRASGTTATPSGLR